VSCGEAWFAVPVAGERHYDATDFAAGHTPGTTVWDPPRPLEYGATAKEAFNERFRGNHGTLRVRNSFGRDARKPLTGMKVARHWAGTADFGSVRGRAGGAVRSRPLFRLRTRKKGTHSCPPGCVFRAMRYDRRGQGGILVGAIESFTTAGLAPRQRRHFWSEVTSRVFTPLDARPAFPDDFNAQLHRASLGSLSLSRAISSPAAVIHTSHGARQTCEQVFLLHLQANGSSVNRQDGREASLGPGDFTLCDSSRPYSVTFDAPNDMLVLRIAAPPLRDRIVNPESFTALRICGSEGIGELASHVLRQLWTQTGAGLEPRIADRLGTNLLDLIVTALCARQAAVPSAFRWMCTRPREDRGSSRARPPPPARPERRCRSRTR